MHVVLQSPFGRALVAIRENADRAELVGLNVYVLRLSSFILAGFLAGTAGALFTLFGRYASTSYMFYHVSAGHRGARHRPRGPVAGGATPGEGHSLGREPAE